MKKLKKVLEVEDAAESLDQDFEDIVALSKRCKFTDCTHTKEPNCAVKKAILEGILSEVRFNSYYRLKNEAAYVSEKKNKTKAIDYMKQLKLYHRNKDVKHEV